MSAAARDHLTVARASDPKVVMAKVIHLEPDGSIRDVEPSPHAFLWNFESVPVNGIESLKQALLTAAADPYAIVVRGEPLMPIGRRALYHDVKYGKHADPGLKPAPRRWVGFDFDNVPCAPAGGDPDPEIYADPAKYHNWALLPEAHPALQTPELGAAIAAKRLPPEFRHASVVWQITGSAGFKAGYRLRLWYWLDHPCTEPELMAWCKPALDRKLVDPVTLRPVQEHFIGVRVVGGSDPCPARFGILKGEADTVKVPDLAGIIRHQKEKERKERRAREGSQTYSLGELTADERTKQRIEECIREVANATEESGRHPIYLEQVARAEAICRKYSIDWPPVRGRLRHAYESLFSASEADRRRRGSIDGVVDWIERRAAS